MTQPIKSKTMLSCYRHQEAWMIRRDSPRISIERSNHKDAPCWRSRSNQTNRFWRWTSSEGTDEYEEGRKGRVQWTLILTGLRRSFTGTGIGFLSANSLPRTDRFNTTAYWSASKSKETKMTVKWTNRIKREFERQTLYHLNVSFEGQSIVSKVKI